MNQEEFYDNLYTCEFSIEKFKTLNIPLSMMESAICHYIIRIKNDDLKFENEILQFIQYLLSFLSIISLHILNCALLRFDILTFLVSNYPIEPILESDTYLVYNILLSYHNNKFEILRYTLDFLKAPIDKLQLQYCSHYGHFEIIPFLILYGAHIPTQEEIEDDPERDEYLGIRSELLEIGESKDFTIDDYRDEILSLISRISDKLCNDLIIKIASYLNKF